jgi:hypothetical protein
MTQATLRRIYCTLAALWLLPVWVVRYLPLQDGPSHLYNSWLLRELILGANGAIAHWFRIDWQPHPNWIGSVALAALMSVVPPLLAEKLFVSAIILTFLAGAWMITEEKAWAFLALPFTFNYMLQSGFYNFSVALGLYFIIVAVWWRRRARTDARTLALVAGLLLLCYFSHPLPLVLAMGSIGLVGMLTRSSPKHLISFIPVLPLLAWFAHARGSGGMNTERIPLGQLWDYIAHTQVLFTFDVWQTRLGVFLFVVTVLLLLMTLLHRERPWRWQPRDAFGVLAVVIVIIYVWSPAALVGGLLVRERMALFVALVPLGWIAPRLPRRATDVCVIVLAIVSLLYNGYIVQRFRRAGRRAEDIVASASGVGTDSAFVPLMLDTLPRGIFLPVYHHTVSYAAIQRRAVDLDNYEAGTGYFPIKWNPKLQPPDLFAIEAQTDFMDVGALTSSAKYIFTWNVRPGSLLWPQLQHYYLPVSERGSGRVWRVARTIDTASGDVRRVLLPVAGSVGRRGAPGGVWWTIDQSVTNHNTFPTHLFVSGCAPELMQVCDIELGPGQTVPLASNGASFLIVYADTKGVDNLTFSTVARRLDPNGTVASLAVPAVPDVAFRKGRVVLDDIPLENGRRVNLRAWSTGQHAPALDVRITDAAGRLLGEKKYAIDANGYSVCPDLITDFPSVRGRCRVTLDTGDGRVWGFVSVSDPSTQIPTPRFPR